MVRSRKSREITQPLISVVINIVKYAVGMFILEDWLWHFSRNEIEEVAVRMPIKTRNFIYKGRHVSGSFNRVIVNVGARTRDVPDVRSRYHITIKIPVVRYSSDKVHSAILIKARLCPTAL